MQKKKTFTSISLIILHVSNINEKSSVRNWQKVNVPFLKKQKCLHPLRISGIQYHAYIKIKNPYLKKTKQTCLSSKMVLSSVHRIDRAMQP